MSSLRLRRDTVTIFSSIPGVAESLQAATSRIRNNDDDDDDTTSSIVPPLDIITDDALGGYGGTVEFKPERLTSTTRQKLKDAKILLSEPSVVASLLKHDADSLASLQWCQSTYAGVDPLFRPSSPPMRRPSWTLTRFAGCFGPPIAEWCLARIIEHERSFAATATDQDKKEWAGSKERVTNYRYLSSLTLSVLGCGDIGRCIAKAGGAFGMKTVGYGKTPKKKEDIGVDEYTLDLKEALQAGDYIVSVLPSSPETRGLLSGETLAPASEQNGGKTPVLLNVGRGDVIDETSVLNALDSGYISKAILDVFETEPLPKDSPLWDHPGVIVSPHVSGLTQPSDVPKVLLANYERYCRQEELLYVVDWNKGY